jgi:hypothetical protein
MSAMVVGSTFSGAITTSKSAPPAPMVIFTPLTSAWGLRP